MNTLRELQKKYHAFQKAEAKKKKIRKQVLKNRQSRIPKINSGGNTNEK